MTDIFHPGRNKTIKVKDIVVKNHLAPNAKGINERQEYVEFTIIGKTSEYLDFLLLAEFKQSNPGFPLR